MKWNWINRAFGESKPAGAGLMLAGCAGLAVYLLFLAQALSGTPGLAAPVEYGVKIVIKLFLLPAALTALLLYQKRPGSKLPAALWACSLTLELVLYVRAIVLAAQAADSPLETLAGVVPPLLSIVTFSCLLAIAACGNRQAAAYTIRRMSVLTAVLAVLFLLVSLIGVFPLLSSGWRAVLGQAILLADGCTVLIPSLRLHRLAVPATRQEPAQKHE